VITENKKFKQLVREYFNSFVKKFPEYGSFLGLHKYDGKWSDDSLKMYLDNIKFFKEYLKNFKKIKSEKLTEKEKLDRKIIIQNLKITIFYLEKLRMWESDPDITEGIGSTLFILLNRERASLFKIIKAINRALENIPSLFEQTKTRILKPYKLWTEIAIESCQGLNLFLEDLKSLRIKKSFKEKFLKNINIAIKATENYMEFLKRQILPKTIDKYVIEKENFKKLIKFRELGLDLAEILKIGERTLKANKEELRKIAEEINPKLTVKQVKEKINKEHLKDFREILKQYKRIVAKAKKFILVHNLMKIPKNEKILIKETPSFLVHITPFAAYFAPPKFAKEKVGIYIITPARQKRLLEKHNYASIFNTSVHESYPGHHLQFVIAFKNPSLVRTLSQATELIEGWAHYCEEYMRDVGFNNTNKIRFIQTLDEVWRAARVIIDIKLHSGEMSFQEAVNFLIKEVDMEKENAITEVKRYTKSPSYQLSYLIGKYLIKKLKREIQEKMGEKYSDRFFHEIILNAGSIPIKYLREEFDLCIKK